MPDPNIIPLADLPGKGPPGFKRPRDTDVIIEETELAPPPPITRHSFAADVVNSFLFFIEPDNLMSFGIVAFFSLLASFFIFSGTKLFVASNVGIMIVGLIIAGVFSAAWIGAYLMRIVDETAGGEDDLPSTSMGGPFETVGRPIAMFSFTWVCLLLPAGVMYLARWSWNLNIPTVWIYAAAWFAVFMWPMAALCISIGGVSTFVRADLMVYTVFRTAGPYAIIWALLLLLIGTSWLIVRLMTTPNAAGTSPILKHPLAASVLMAFVFAYAAIVAMKLIGLYYRHFKHRFAWSWE
ncbi:MAG: hypothetical protein HOP29_01785 [Phycisphaerales bacterium]|nr:hypothetical protein [Phycisphaerales bacterium]